MKVEKTTSATGQWGLQAFPEDYDGTPSLPTIQFDRQPRTLSPDRVALAGYLLFGPWISGRYVSPQWHSPALSQAMSRDARPAWLQTEPVELYAKSLPKGRRPFVVTLEGTQFDGAGMAHVSRMPLLTLRRSDLSSGARASGASLELSTNAWLLAVNQPPERQLAIVVACAVLFAEDLDGDEVIVNSAAPKASSRSLAELVGASRLGIRA